jgi:hypothetical protein
MKYLLLCAIVLMAACAKHHAPAPAPPPVDTVANLDYDTVWFQFVENGAPISWWTLDSIRPKTISLERVDTAGSANGYYLHAVSADGEVMLRISVDTTASPGAGVYGFSGQATGAGFVRFGDTLWQTLVSDTVYVFNVVNGYSSGGFQGTWKPSSGDTTRRLRITAGRFRQVPFQALP